MRKSILTVLSAALFAASASQNVAAAARHPAGKTEPAKVSEQFRNANNQLAARVPSGWTYSGYSAPAGR